MRDFFYNRGDVLITVLIVLVAATVIYFRVGVVMGDPEPGERLKNMVVSLFSTSETADEPLEGTTVDEGAQGGLIAETPEQTTPPADEPGTVAEAPVVDDEPSVEEPPAQEPPAATSGEVKITVNAGDAASTIANKLKEAGAITDTQAFLSEVMAQKADSRLKQGTFTIPSGSSINDIIKILVG